MLCVVDVTRCEREMGALWSRSRFLERVTGIADRFVIFDPRARQWPVEAAVVSDMKSVRAVANASAAPIIVHVEGGQVFLDPDVALNGLVRFRNRGRDYLTQWEHCRLPVGIGVRAVRAEALDRIAARNFDEVFAAIRREPGSFDGLYDDHPYVGFDRMHLDSRATPTTAALLAAEHPERWGLDGFLAIAEGRPEFRYEAPSATAACRDERGMPAAYGFESDACADFPTYVMFDLTNRCNATCIHCPQSVGFEGQETTRFLSFADYRKVIDECVGRPIDFVRLTADGEPLLHPDVYDMIAYASARGVGPVGLTSNGSALNERNANRLLDAGLDVIDVSLDAFTPDTFATVRAGLSYERTVGNLRRLIALRDRRAAPLKIMVSFVSQPQNAHERAAFETYWTPIVDKVLIRELHTNAGLNPPAGEADDSGRRWPCPHWFRRTVITHTGEIKACPIDWNNESVYRPVAETTIRDAWHSDFYRRNRHEHLNNDFSPCSLCKGCDDWRETPWSLGYEKVIRSLAPADAA